MTTQTINIIVLGGRYSGVMATLRLAREAGLQVNGQNQVLIDPYFSWFDYKNIRSFGQIESNATTKHLLTSSSGVGKIELDYE